MDDNTFSSFLGMLGLTREQAAEYSADKDRERVVKIYADFRWKMKIRELAFEDIQALLKECIEQVEQTVKTKEIRDKAVGEFRKMEAKISEFAVEPEVPTQCPCGRELDASDYRKYTESGRDDGMVLCPTCLANGSSPP